MADREHDIVVFGATGFTGTLTAEYLARHAPASTGIGLAGRNRSKLERLRSHLAAIDPACAELELLEADVDEPSSIRAVAESAKVVISTVGPYILYGEPLVAACAAAGTDYVDLAGEPEFVDLMWLRHHERAQRSGARLVHSCGFDSIPYDLGVLFTVQQLPENVPIHVDGFLAAGGTFSGGTYHSAVQIIGRLRQGAQVARERRQREGRPQGRQIKGSRGKPHRDSVAGGWVTPLPTIDPQTVLRSARALDRYGPEFSYSHYLVAGQLPVLVGLTAGAGAVIALAQLPPARRALLKLKDPGDGPSPEQREKGWFRVRFAARAGGPPGIQPRLDGPRPGQPAGGGKRVVTEVSGGDPGYDETAKMLAESALCLAHDELPERAGQLTPAVAMGDRLTGRLQQAGIKLRALD